MTQATLDTVTYMQTTQDVVALEKYPNRAGIWDYDAPRGPGPP
jgi:hypothetical protein